MEIWQKFGVKNVSIFLFPLDVKVFFSVLGEKILQIFVQFLDYTILTCGTPVIGSSDVIAIGDPSLADVTQFGFVSSPDWWEIGGRQM